MQAMAMTPEEKQQFLTLKEEVHEMKEEVSELKSNWAITNAKIDKILATVRGIGIGLAIGGVMFGLVKFPELLKFFTK